MNKDVYFFMSGHRTTDQDGVVQRGSFWTHPTHTLHFRDGRFSFVFSEIMANFRWHQTVSFRHLPRKSNTEEKPYKSVDIFSLEITTFFVGAAPLNSSMAQQYPGLLKEVLALNHWNSDRYESTLKLHGNLLHFLELIPRPLGNRNEFHSWTEITSRRRRRFRAPKNCFLCVSNGTGWMIDAFTWS